jgi:hypothetical protein
MRGHWRGIHTGYTANSFVAIVGTEYEVSVLVRTIGYLNISVLNGRELKHLHMETREIKQFCNTD